MALPLSREEIALAREQLASPEAVLAALAAATEALQREGRPVAADAAFALLARRLADQACAGPGETLEQTCQLRIRERRSVPQIVALLAEPIGYDEPRKQAFRSEAQRLLKQLAGALGLAKADFDLSWNAGGVAVSGDAYLHSDQLFVSVSQGCGPGPVMFRTVHHRRDYRGRMNHWAGASELADPTRLAERIARELGLPRPPTGLLL